MIITVEDLEKHYGSHTVFDDASFSIESGKSYGLIGVNGVGKTTLINILTGQETRDNGEVSVFGMDPQKNPLEVRHKVGILPEKQSPPSTLKANEFLHYIGIQYDIDKASRQERIDELSKKLDLEDKLDSYCKTLSRGQQQKVMFMKALLPEPELVIVDEPVANLDPIMQKRVNEILIEISDDDERTLLLSTHQTDLAESVAEEFLIVTQNGIQTETTLDSDNIEKYYE